jgi:hypothetical protein
MNPFDFVNSINHTKKNLMEEDPLCEGDYVPFVTNRQLSYFVDTLLYSNEMNRYHHLDHRLQFDYLINSIRPKKRYSRWAKSDESEDLKMISEYYGYSIPKARQALSLLSQDQVDWIRQKFSRGVTDGESTS